MTHINSTTTSPNTRSSSSSKHWNAILSKCSLVVLVTVPYYNMICYIRNNINTPSETWSTTQQRMIHAGVHDYQWSKGPTQHVNICTTSLNPTSCSYADEQVRWSRWEPSPSWQLIYHLVSISTVDRSCYRLAVDLRVKTSGSDVDCPSSITYIRMKYSGFRSFWSINISFVSFQVSSHYRRMSGSSLVDVEHTDVKTTQSRHL